MRHKAIAIIGGSGFIGSHLVNALVEMGKDVRIATRWRYNARHLTMLPIDVIEMDVFDPVQLARFVEGADCVINLVATLHGKRGKPYGPEFARMHVDLPTKIVAACEGKGVHRLIHISALGADSNGPSMYSRSPGELVISRDNLDSMKLDNVLSGPLSPALGIVELASIEAIVPVYLTGESTRSRFDAFRATAGR
ncbi:MAG: NAD-dependent epimerase/dehydratase [uncultured Paraburkholderia sp.]|nr:MAG: NAD-dependent epimerase/dehydratase [uncultured Paraburkholderia sp.]CAH2922725.1 MAG: NAD-dependent epimerase/dehydratase [uncultured Paraburkholderia sp.]